MNKVLFEFEISNVSVIYSFKMSKKRKNKNIIISIFNKLMLQITGNKFESENKCFCCFSFKFMNNFYSNALRNNSKMTMFFFNFLKRNAFCVGA